MPRAKLQKPEASDRFQYTIDLDMNDGQAVTETAKRLRISVNELIKQVLASVIFNNSNGCRWVTIGVNREDWEKMEKMAGEWDVALEEVADDCLHNGIESA